MMTTNLDELEALCDAENARDRSMSQINYPDTPFERAAREALPALIARAKEADRRERDAIEVMDKLAADKEILKERVRELENLITRTVDSGLLCDPGCCGDDCVCDQMREVASHGRA